MSQHQPLTFREDWPSGVTLGLALIVLLSLINFLFSLFLELTPLVRPSGLLVYGSASAILSEVVLLGFLLVFLPFGLMVRIGLVSFLGMLLWLCFIAGAYLFTFPSRYGFEEIAKQLPICLFAIATPFAVAKHFLGWRIGFDGLSDRNNVRMSTVGLMVATGLIAVGVAIMSTGRQDLIFIGLIAVATCVAFGLIICLPLSWMLLSSRRPFLIVAAIFLVTLCVLYLAILLIEQYVGPFNRWIRIGITFAAATFPVWIGFELFLIRKFGGKFRMDRQIANANQDAAEPTHF